jgi:hypothetical protein
MCCGHESHHHGGFCACDGHSRLGPGFWTEKEKIAWLEKYLEWLKEEAKAVEERIAALREER